LHEHGRFSLSWSDALIVAAALRVGCRYLLSEDLQDGQTLDGLTAIGPFVHGPDLLLAD
jgi:predicted nucleic acid-binding protein